MTMSIKREIAQLKAQLASLQPLAGAFRIRQVRPPLPSMQEIGWRRLPKRPRA
jgi:hypothetical protein